MYADSSLAILCGGQGKRLGGVPKGLLTIEGETFIARLLALRPLFADTFLVTSDPAPYQVFQVRAVADAWIGAGTPGALITALCASSTAWTFVVGVDMPLVSPSAIGELAQARSADVGAVVPEIGGRTQSLGGFYRAALREPFAERLDSGEVPSIRELHALTSVRTLAPTDPRAFVNVNTDQELNEIRALRPSAR